MTQPGLLVALFILVRAVAFGQSAPPAITTQPISSSVSAGQTLTLSFTTNGVPTPTIQWFKNGVVVSGATNSSLIIPSVGVGDAGTYTAGISSFYNGSTYNLTTAPAVVTVNATAPWITSQPSSGTITLGQTLTLSVSAFGSPMPTYQWRKNGQLIAGATVATYTVASARTEDAGAYSVIVSNSVGSVTSGIAQVAVNVPPTIITQPPSQSTVAVALGQRLTLSVAATGDPSPSYEWRRNGVAISGATSATFTVGAAKVEDAGSYAVVVSNAAGSVTSSIARVAISVPPTITTQPLSQAVVAGGNVTLSIVATGVEPLLYSWTRGGIELSEGTTSSLTINGVQSVDAGDYRVSIMDSANPIVLVSAGSYHTMFLKADGSLWAMGNNGSGQLGDGTRSNRSIPLQVASGVVGVSAGNEHTMFVRSDGSLWGAGSNRFGQLGDGIINQLNFATPLTGVVAGGQRVGQHVQVVGVSAGWAHTMFIKSDGSLWGMGRNDTGQLGDGTRSSRTTPVQVASGVESVSAGAQHTMFVKRDGSLWGMGLNSEGSLGDGSVIQRDTPVLVANGVVGVSAGFGHSMFIKRDGSLWGMGSNFNSELGDSSATTRRTTPVQLASGVVSVSAGTVHTMFIKTDGSLWGMGLNSYSSLGDGTSARRDTPVQVASGVASVSAGGDHTMFLKTGTGGWLWGAGSNSSGELGDGTTTTRSRPVRSIGGVLSNSATLTVMQPPVITRQPASQTLAVGFPMELSVVATGGSILSYQWRRSGVNIPGATNTLYAIPAAGVGDSGLYSVVVTNFVSSVISSEAFVTVNSAEPAAIVVQPTNVTASIGQSATFSLTASGSPLPAIQWLKNGAEILGATNAAYTIDSVSQVDAASYTARVQNIYNRTTYSIITSPALLAISANSVPFSIAIRPSAVVVNAGGVISLSATGVGPSEPTFHWRKDGVAIIGASKSAYTIPSSKVEDAGAYTVLVSNVAGSVTSSSAQVTVNVAPTITTQPIAVTVTLGQSLALYVATSGTPTPTFQWRKDGVAIGGATSATYTVASSRIEDAGAYTVLVSNSAGSVTSNSVQVAVNPFARIINLSILTPLQAGEIMTLGTVLGGSGTSGSKALLVRGAGPSLGQFRVADFMPDPKLDLYRGQTLAATNENWGGTSQLVSAFSSVGAFAYVGAASRDAAIYSQSLAAGNYTVLVQGEGLSAGSVIAELYDATPSRELTAATPRLVNVSVLKDMKAGDVLTVGFVIGGVGTRRVLIRAVGPTLGLPPFNIAGVMSDPKVTLYLGQQVIATNDNWGSQASGLTAAQITSASDGVGAFRIGDSSSKDCVLLASLNPGNYTAQVTSSGVGGGFVITEVYEVP